ncbi:MAG: tetratricopeptide repeat protein [Flavobacteriales bacterium]
MFKLVSTIKGSMIAGVILAFVLFGNTLRHDFVLDDGLVIVNNNIIKHGYTGVFEAFQHSHTFGATGIEDSGYRPIPIAIFSILWALTGGTPFGFHLLNVFLFGLTLGIMLQVLFRGFRDQLNQTQILLITMLFAVHPLHSEVVANVKELEDILQLLFVLTSWWFLIRFVEVQNYRMLVFSSVFLALAMLSKETSLMFIIVAPIYLFLFSSATKRKALIAAGSLMATAVVFWGVRYVAVDMNQQIQLTVLNNALASLPSRWWQIVSALWMQVEYLTLFFYPSVLSFDYSFNQIPLINVWGMRAIAALILGLLSVGITVYLLVEKRVSGFGLAFYLLMMVPVSNIIVLIGSTMAERFAYMPSLGMSVAVVALLWESKFFQKRKKLAQTLLIVASLLLGTRTLIRNKDWKSDEVLFAADVVNSPMSTRTHMTLGTTLLQKSSRALDQQQALALVTQARKHLVTSVEILPENYESHYNIGVIDQQFGRDDLALKSFERCLEIAPEYALALNNAGVIHFNRKEYEKAEECFLSAYKINQLNGDILANRALVEYRKGNYAEAIPYAEQALKVNPMHQGAKNMLAGARQALAPM